MESNSVELQDKNSKGENLIGSAGNFDDSELKKRKIKRIIIIISVILLVTIIVLIIRLSLGSKKDKCEIGENEKCLKCKKNSKKFSKCNPYFRLENGKCEFIYSFEAIYELNPVNDI